MQDQVTKNAKLMALIQAQTQDKAWLFEVAEALSLTPADIENDTWDLKHWNPLWGQLDKTLRGTKIIVVWKRPDGGDTLADVSELPIHIRMLRFALLGQLSVGLNTIGQLSYVRTGFPSNWNKCKVYCDSREMQGVISADALLGVVHMYRRDPKGKLVMKDDGKTIDRERTAGRIEIKIEEKVQTLF